MVAQSIISIVTNYGMSEQFSLGINKVVTSKTTMINGIIIIMPVNYHTV